MNAHGIHLMALPPGSDPALGNDRNIVSGNRVKNCTNPLVDEGTGNLVVNNLL